MHKNHSLNLRLLALLIVFSMHKIPHKILNANVSSFICSLTGITNEYKKKPSSPTIFRLNQAWHCISDRQMTNFQSALLISMRNTAESDQYLIPPHARPFKMNTQIKQTDERMKWIIMKLWIASLFDGPRPMNYGTLNNFKTLRILSQLN